MTDGPRPSLKVSWRAVVLWMLGRRKRIHIQGYSMTPALRPGDHVIVALGAFVRRPPIVGDVVLCRHPHEKDRTMVKRVYAVTSAGIDVRGDNQDISTDSREFGTLPRELLLGRVVGRFPG